MNQDSAKKVAYGDINALTGMIVDAAFKIHTELGPGLLESVYEMVLARELQNRGLSVERQRQVNIEYDGIIHEDAFRADIIVENLVVIELKSVEVIAPVHSKQLLTYIRLLKLPVGLLLNFGAATIKEGTRRVMNNQILCPSL